MPVALDVNKEAVQVLVGAVGVREAARQMGLSENTVLAWANRGGWVQHIANAQERKVQSLASNRPDSLQSPAIKPADALENVMRKRENHTRLGLSLYAARASRQASRIPKNELLDAAPSVKAVADVMAKVWPEAQAGPATGQAMVLNINVLGASPDQHPVTLDLPPDEPPADPMDSF